MFQKAEFTKIFESCIQKDSTDPACHAWVIHDVWLSTNAIACHAWFTHDVWLSTFYIPCSFTHDVWLSTYAIACHAWFTHGVWLSTYVIHSLPCIIYSWRMVEYICHSLPCMICSSRMVEYICHSLPCCNSFHSFLLTVYTRSLQQFYNQVLGSFFFLPAYVQYICTHILYMRQVRGFCGYKDKPHSIRPETEHSSYGCLYTYIQWMTFPCTTFPHTTVLYSRQRWAVRK